LVMQNISGEARQAEVPVLPGLHVTGLSVGSTTSKFDLTLSVAETGQGLCCQMKYATDLFEAETIIRMLTHFQTLLEGVVQNPLARISDLPLPPTAERNLLLMEQNATKADYPQDRCVHQLFEEQVERAPDSIAIAFQEEQMTYSELYRRVHQVAHHLS